MPTPEFARARPRPAIRHAGALLIATVLSAAMGTGTAIVRAQRPERKRDVTVPGTDVVLSAGWKMVFHQECRFMIPASWSVDPDGGIAVAPDGSNISIRMFNVENWSAHKGRIKAAFGQVNRLHEDSERRLWLEIGDQRRAQHYVDVLSGPAVCSAVIDIRRASASDGEDTIRKIVESVGPGSGKFPSDGK
jgi:hypothetical protein